MIFGYDDMAPTRALAPRGTLFKKHPIFLKMFHCSQFWCYIVHIIVYNGITYHLVLVTTLFCIKTGFYRDKMGIFLGFVPLKKLILTQI